MTKKLKHYKINLYEKQHAKEEHSVQEHDHLNHVCKNSDGYMEPDQTRHIHTSGPTTHMHMHQNKKAVINRLSRAIGHLEAVKKMVEEDRDCSEVLIQLAAVRSALNNTGKIILEEHIEHCIVDAIKEGNHEAVDNLNKAIKQFIK